MFWAIRLENGRILLLEGKDIEGGNDKKNVSFEKFT